VTRSDSSHRFKPHDGISAGHMSDRGPRLQAAGLNRTWRTAFPGTIGSKGEGCLSAARTKYVRWASERRSARLDLSESDTFHHAVRLAGRTPASSSWMRRASACVALRRAGQDVLECSSGRRITPGRSERRPHPRALQWQTSSRACATPGDRCVSGAAQALHGRRCCVKESRVPSLLRDVRSQYATPSRQDVAAHDVCTGWSAH